MCSFIGFCNINYDISSLKNTETIKALTHTLAYNNQCKKNIYSSKNICLGHKNLNIVDSENGKQPMNFKHNQNTYTIVYNGKLYNVDNLRNELIKLGYEFNRIF